MTTTFTALTDSEINERYNKIGVNIKLGRRILEKEVNGVLRKLYFKLRRTTESKNEIDTVIDRETLLNTILI